MNAMSTTVQPMREIVFRVLNDVPGLVEAVSTNQQIRISASSLEELHHEAREALIERLGPSHCAYRVRLQRPATSSQIRPLQRPLPQGC